MTGATPLSRRLVRRAGLLLVYLVVRHGPGVAPVRDDPCGKAPRPDEPSDTGTPDRPAMAAVRLPNQEPAPSVPWRPAGTPPFPRRCLRVGSGRLGQSRKFYDLALKAIV